MPKKSTFKSDLQKETALYPLVNRHYENNLKCYTFERVKNRNADFRGIDLYLKHKISGARYLVDEKAQVDYINEDLPTFAFELFYHKNEEKKLGWLLNPDKHTEFYSLITAIYSDAPNTYTSCKITFVNRSKLLHYLRSKSLQNATWENIYKTTLNEHGKIIIPQLQEDKEGYLFKSSKNKAEKPLNLILRLEFLVSKGIAKRLL